MSGGPPTNSKSHRKLNKKAKHTRDATTQCGKWLALKKAVEKNEVLRAEALEYVDNIIAQMGYPLPQDLSSEEERVLKESREALSCHHIADLALMVEPLNTCKWNV